MTINDLGGGVWIWLGHFSRSFCKHLETNIIFLHQPLARHVSNVLLKFEGAMTLKFSQLIPGRLGTRATCQYQNLNIFFKDVRYPFESKTHKKVHSKIALILDNSKPHKPIIGLFCWQSALSPVQNTNPKSRISRMLFSRKINLKRSKANIPLLHTGNLDFCEQKF